MPNTIIQSQIRQAGLDTATYTDSVSKMRVSTPESLIDTDFEYGAQGVKWETLQLVNNIPTFFSRTGDTPFPLIDVQCRSNSDYIYLYFTAQSPPAVSVGSPFLITGLRATFAAAEGSYVVNKVIASNIICYKAKLFMNFTGSIYDSYSTLMYPGQFYSGTAYNLDQLSSIITDGNNPSTITVTTNTPHGFSSNTYFILVNSIGKKQITFDSSTIASNTIISPIHDYPDFTQVTYTNISGSIVPGLTNNGTYYTYNTTGNTLQLSSTPFPATPVNITYTTGALGTSIQSLVSTNNASDGTSYYINSIPTPTTFNLATGTQILQNIYNFVPRISLNMQCNCINFGNTPHQYASGAPFIYNPLGNTPIYLDTNPPTGSTANPMTSNTVYYAIRLDAYNLQLSTTQQLFPPYTPANLYYPDTATAATSNQLILNAIGGEKYGTGYFQPTVNSTTVVTSNINIQTIFKVGDYCRIETPQSNIVYNNITLQSTQPNILVGSTMPTTYPTGTYIKISNLSTSLGSVVNNNFGYYIRPYVVGSVSNYTLYQSYYDAINNYTPASISGSGTATITIYTPGSVFESQINFIGSASKFTVSAPYGNSNNSGQYLQYFQKTGLYPRADGYAVHRPYDGGIELIPPRNADGQVIRQTRRYFRYQPGKGIQVSLSVNFSAPIEIDRLQTLTANTNIATATTKTIHRLQAGLNITVDTIKSATVTSVSGVYPMNPMPPWTGTYTVISTPDQNTFTYQMGTTFAQPTVASNIPIVFVNGWSGSKMRVGMFDDQNGMFFEYDGSTLYAVRRDAVTQITGQSSVVYGSTQVSGILNNSYLSEIPAGSNVVIRGQIYKIANIATNNTFYIQPAYRGISSSNVIISVITDIKTPQSQWNIDKCDGTGPTGYNLDIHKIQMIYYDYSWYGAGKIRYGFKDTTGIVRYVHEYIHNNNCIRAYFRSGNLPARYEVTNYGLPTWSPSLLHWGTSAIMDGRYDDDKAYLFTASANVIQFTAGDTIQCYTTAGAVALPLYTGSVSGATITDYTTLTSFYDAYQQKQVSGYSLFTTAQSAGGYFTSNLSYKDVQNIRSGTLITGCNIQSGTTTVGTAQRGIVTGLVTGNGNVVYTGQLFINKPVTAPFNWGSITIGNPADLIPNIIPLVSIRLTPSVDSSITGPLGSRELINKMLLKIRSIDLLTTNDTECRVYLNPYLDNQNWTAASSPSLSQLIQHNKNDNIQGGINIFSFRVAGGSTDASGKRSTTVTSQDLALLGSIQNSILGGNSVYPDGPDVVSVCAICLDSAGVSATTPYIVSSRLTWTEAQS